MLLFWCAVEPPLPCNTLLNRHSFTTLASEPPPTPPTSCTSAAQFVEPCKASNYDWPRTARLASFGFLVHGPSGHAFYGALDRRLPGTKPSTVAAKVLIDQIFWNPCFAVMVSGGRKKSSSSLSSIYSPHSPLTLPPLLLLFLPLLRQFFTYLGLTEGKTLADITKKIKA